MKIKKIKNIIIISIAFIVLVLFLLYYFNYIIIGKNLIKKDIPEKDCVIIAENSYINGAWEYVYDGHFICDNGDIYEFYVGDPDVELSDLFNSDYVEYTGYKVPKNGLKELNSLIATIKNKNIEKVVAQDMGSWYTQVYYNNKSYTLFEKGDWVSVNTSFNTIKTLNLLNYYFNIVKK